MKDIHTPHDLMRKQEGKPKKNEENVELCLHLQVSRLFYQVSGADLVRGDCRDRASCPSTFLLWVLDIFHLPSSSSSSSHHHHHHHRVLKQDALSRLCRPWIRTMRHRRFPPLFLLLRSTMSSSLACQIKPHLLAAYLHCQQGMRRHSDTDLLLSVLNGNLHPHKQHGKRKIGLRMRFQLSKTRKSWR